MKPIFALVVLTCLALPGAAQAGDGVVRIDDFEGEGNIAGTSWFAGCDKNNLGTTLAPDPFVPETGGAPASPKKFARIHGHFGKSVAPYPWAGLSTDLGTKPVDLSAYKGVSFSVKGKGRGKIIITKDSVKDYADYQFIFTLTQKWTPITVLFDGFTQPSWGKAVPRDFKDAKQIKITPEDNDADYDIGIDDLAFIKDPNGKAPAPFTVAASVPQVSLKELLAKNIAYSTIPLGAEAKWSFKDDVEGDGKGGWTDQGTNSLYDFPTGRRVLEGVPFDIAADPKRQTIVLRGQNKAVFPTSAEVPVKKKGKAVYFLHGAAWAAPVVATYTVVYSDGQEEQIPIRNGVEIFDWWTPGNSKVARPGWTGKNPVHAPVGLTLLAWQNPRPDVEIAKVKLETTGKDSFLMLAGITVAAEGPYLARPNYKTYKTEGWFAYEGFDVQKRKGTALDMSHLLDAPAGKHGFVQKPNGESFTFEDGSEARFFGLDVVAASNFPTHGEADQMADLMAEMGVNITRHHHMDADWADRNVWGKKDNTLALDAESMDRFDYLVAALQKRGIYQYLDLLVHRHPFDKDGIDDAKEIGNGYKLYASWVPRLIQLQKLYVKLLLTHKNPYTGKAYGDDPGVAMQEVINEDSLFYRGADAEWTIKGQRYNDMWNGQYNAWLSKNIGDRAKLEARWAPGPNESAKKGLQPSEDPKAGTVFCIDSWLNDSYKQYTRQRVLDTYYYYYAIEAWYYGEMASYVRQFRKKGLVTGSNHWANNPIDNYVNARTDYLDRHEYWAIPSGGYGFGPSVSFDPTSMTKSAKGGLFGMLTARRVKGSPMIVTEWQDSAPNDFHHEGLLYMAAACDFQNWSAVEFQFGTADGKPAVINDPFDSTAPSMLAAWPMASMIFHRKDVKASTETAYYPLSDAEVFSPETQVKLPEGLPFVARSGLEFTGQAKSQSVSALVEKYVKGKTATSTTGELKADWDQGYFRIDTPRTQGFTGFSKGHPQSFSNLQVTLDNDYGMVVASSLDTKPIAETSKLLISAVGNAVNKGMELEPGGDRVRVIGEMPVLVEPMVGTVSLKGLTGNLAKAEVWALNPSGTRTTKVPSQGGQGTLSFKISGQHKAMHYEIVRP